MRKLLLLITLLAACCAPASAQLYYMPYGTRIPYGPYLNQAQYGSGWRPMSMYERDRYYQQRYFNRTYVWNGRRLTPVRSW